MTGPPLFVPLDVADEIRELHAAGVGFSRIMLLTDVPSATAWRIVRGEHRNYSDALSTRQRTRLLAGWPVS